MDRPATAGEGDAEIIEWRQPDPPPHLRAWSWGSLTSGRWYHAFYGRIEDHARSGQDPLLVAAHSQGGVIAGTAVLGTSPDADLRSIGLLTFGSPWHRLYAEFFPAYFPSRTDKALYNRLAGRWRNLFRATDPIGGPVGCAGVDKKPLADPSGLRHSDYWLEREYADAVPELLDLTAAPCRVASSVATPQR